MKTAAKNTATKRTTPEIPQALRNFNFLPESANVRLPVVAALFACSGATVWRRVKAGTLPKPRKLGERITAWNVGEIRRALEQ